MIVSRKILKGTKIVSLAILSLKFEVWIIYAIFSLLMTRRVGLYRDYAFSQIFGLNFFSVYQEMLFPVTTKQKR